MSLQRRAATILASDGWRGLLRRGAGKVLRTLTGRPHPDAARRAAHEAQEAARQKQQGDELARQMFEYKARAETFRAEVQRRALGDVEGFYWYHTIDLGNGLVTPGDYDFRNRLSDYPFPADMRGRTVLDVGSATGFFAFEFERRGAEVLSVELPSIADWDMIWSDRDALLGKLMTGHGAGTLSDLDRAHLHGPFEFCRRLLSSRVRRCLSRISDLTLEKVGGAPFDTVFLGDVLSHTFSPLQALNVLAPLCGRELIITVTFNPKPEAALTYVGGASAALDSRSWFMPNWECLRQMLARVGFRDVRTVGRSRVLVRRAWLWSERDVIVATK
jgi:tRNA (mo5U34)-methyltransferase